MQLLNSILLNFQKKPAAKQTNKKQKESEEPESKGPKDDGGNQMYQVSLVLFKATRLNEFRFKIVVIQLSKMRFVSVSQFHGKPLVNIREYYESNGKLLPGKKGVSLSTDQWDQLKKFIDKIDNDISNSSKQIMLFTNIILNIRFKRVSI